MIGIIGAMVSEIEGLQREMTDTVITETGMNVFTAGKLCGRDVVISICGPGKVNAALCTQAMIMLYHPDTILNIGVAGSGDKSVGIFDMVIGTAAVQHDMDTSPIGDPVCYVSRIGLIQIPCDKAVCEDLRAAAEAEGIRCHEGIIATGDQFICRAEQKDAIRAKCTPLAVEMEGAAVAHACYMHGVKCGILRSVSDNADGEAEVDYPVFAERAAAETHRVVKRMLERLP
ncbi:MAG: 5'-methylthioadenosine/adenosylhomocysteine nucleosidase [Clostridia bacterium]|nr:5'-methylthioadenosine/adenosylhomocysteine nucleosidase [Clostridia bacterium]